MTELIWDGKYKDGKKQGPVRVALPFQTVETVNESAQDRQRTLELFATGREAEWRNRLIWGDKKYVLPSLLPEFAGKVNLIYIDPPFDTGADFSFTATIPDLPETPEDETALFTKQASMIEQKAYRDTWGRGMDSYLQWLYETILVLRELMAGNGSIYVHLDWHVGYYAKAVLDEVLGSDHFVNEIVWQKIRTTKAQSLGFGSVHDSIYLYSRAESPTFNRQLKELDPAYIESHYKTDPKTGRLYRTVSLLQKGAGPARNFGGKLLSPPSGSHWIWSQERIDKSMAEARIRITSGGRPEKIQFLDEIEGDIVDDIWSDIYPINSQALESLRYATQKPEALLQRIIKASSNEGDLLLDCFVGSGTAAAVAEKLNRRWIACDLSRFAIHTTRKRLLGIPGVKPFIVQNLGKYERQAWQAAEFPASGGDGAEAARLREVAYRNFILELYRATPVSGHGWLHGCKGGRMVHVAPVDAPVTLADVKAIAKEVWKAAGTGKDGPAKAGVDILGWEFAFEVNELGRQVAAESRVDVALKKIPHEVLDKKAVEQGDVRFFELGALSVTARQKKRELALKLSDFLIPIDDIPEDVRKAIKHWSQMIDYWAVDWDFKDDTFHNQWQSYRTRKEPKIELEASHVYPEAGKYTVVIKVIDILGNDTTKAIEVEVG
jgi:adenine-specific DNA-methyltransferase